jgi:hypothetical protein
MLRIVKESDAFRYMEKVVFSTVPYLTKISIDYDVCKKGYSICKKDAKFYIFWQIIASMGWAVQRNRLSIY